MLLATINGLNRNKYFPVVCCLKKTGAYGELIKNVVGADNLFSLNFPEISGIGNLSRFFTRLFSLVKILKNKKIDIIHSYLFQANLLARFAGKISGIPIIISSVRVKEREKTFQLWVNRLTNFMVDKIITNSFSVTGFTLSEENVAPDKLETIPNGIDFFETNNLVRNNPVPELHHYFPDIDRKNIFLIGTAGRLHKQKGIEYLLAAAGIVKISKNNVKFLMVGDGPSGDELKAHAKKLGLNDTVKFTGWKNQDETLCLINSFDLFVLPSLWEGMPNVVMEAMSLGKPVIATTSAVELITDKVTGLLIPPADAETLAESIIWVMEHPEESKAMGKKAKQFIEENYSIDKMVHKTESVYEKLISEYMAEQQT